MSNLVFPVSSYILVLRWHSLSRKTASRNVITDHEPLKLVIKKKNWLLIAQANENVWTVASYFWCNVSFFYLRFLRKERLLLGCPMPTCRNEENIDNFSWLKLSPVHYNLPKQPFSILKWYNFHCNESFSFLLSYLYYFYVYIQYSCVFGWDNRSIILCTYWLKKCSKSQSYFGISYSQETQ